MSSREVNRREAGLGLVSAVTKVMAVGAVGLTGGVALLADHVYNAQHSAATVQTARRATVSVQSGDDGSSLQGTPAPSAASSSKSSSSSSKSSSSSGSVAIVSGGS